MALSYTTFGPFFKVTCTPSDLPAATEADLVGVLEARRCTFCWLAAPTGSADAPRRAA